MPKDAKKPSADKTDRSPAAEQRYRSIFQSNAAGIAIFSLDKKIELVNDEFCRMCGFSKKELIGKLWGDLVPPEDLPKLNAYNRLRLKDPQSAPRKYELRYLNRDGKIKYAIESIELIEGGTKILASFQDITDRVISEKELNESEEKYRFLFDSMSQGVVVQDADGTFLEANNRAAQILGLSVSQLTGKTAFDPRWRAIHEDGSDWPGAQHPINTALKTGKPISEVVMGVFDPGSNEYRWILVSAFPRFRDGDKKPYQAYATFSDITDRKLLESEITRERDMAQGYLDIVGTIVVVIDQAGRVSLINKYGANLLGYSSEEILGKNWFDNFISPNERVAVKKVFKQIIQGKITGVESYENQILTKNGDLREISWRNNYLTGANGEIIQTLSSGMDITDRKVAEEKLKRQAQTIKGIINSTGGPVFSLDTKYRYTSFNENHAKVMNSLYGVNLELGKNMLDYMTVPEDRRIAKANIDRALSGERVLEESFSGEEGRTRNYFEVSHNPIKDETGRVIGIGIMARDLTAKRAVEIALKASEARYRDLFSTMIEGFAFCQAIYGKDGNMEDWLYIDANRAFEKITGLKNVAGKPVSKVIPSLKKDNKELFEIYGKVAKTGKPADFETFLPALNQWLHVSVFSPAKDHFVAVFEDVTARRQVNATLIENEKRMRSIIDNAPFGAHLYELKSDGRLVYIAGNESADRILGINCDQFIGMTLEEAFPGNVGTELPDMYRRAAKSGEPYSTRQVTYDAEGISGVFEVHAVQTSPNHMAAFFRDITEANKAQIEMEKSEKKYRDIFENATEGIVQATIEGELITANPRFIKMLGFDTENEFRQRVFNMKTLYVREQDREPMVEQLLKTGHVAKYEVEMRKKGGDHIWASINSTLVSGEQVDKPYLESLIEDITEKKITEQELIQSHKSLEESLLGLVATLALTVETRDPYTAEHQKRVTDLSVAIARDMGLSDDDIAGLKMAASIHDIGKIYVPAETLNKPGKVTSVEFELIKTHSEAGHNIVKDIKFSQPISEIILQHHERIDGSGYPNGLKGDAIHIRAKIVAVADVVEAMCSHRPYRPALGVPAALEEIEKNSGILYDKDVADTCLKLFQEANFTFK